MKIMISHTSMQPIYEQIMEQIKKQIMQGELREGDALASVRVLAKDLKVSALTVKKAYDLLEEEGLISTVHGKGSFILGTNPAMLEEQRRREVETAMEQAVRKGRAYGMGDGELRELLELLLEP
ncbi:MAG: GntR family transcriptional regulator [Roseburia sp.]|nr:GntR family transcriptional regulator [Roseburia sp.]